MALDKFAKIVIEITNQLGPPTLAAKKHNKLKMKREYVQMWYFIIFVLIYSFALAEYLVILLKES